MPKAGPPEERKVTGSTPVSTTKQRSLGAAVAVSGPGTQADKPLSGDERSDEQLSTADHAETLVPNSSLEMSHTARPDG